MNTDISIEEKKHFLDRMPLLIKIIIWPLGLWDLFRRGNKTGKYGLFIFFTILIGSSFLIPDLPPISMTLNKGTTVCTSKEKVIQLRDSNSYNYNIKGCFNLDLAVQGKITEVDGRIRRVESYSSKFGYWVLTKK